MNLYLLDSQIREKFSLFKGIRSKEEDERIYQRIYDACFEEIIKFLYQNLDDQGKNQILEDLNSKKGLEEKITTIVRNIEKTGQNVIQLNQRLEKLLENVFNESEEIVEKRLQRIKKYDY